MIKKLKIYCPYSVLDLEWRTLKNLQNITFEKPWYLKKNNNDTKRKRTTISRPLW